MAKERGDVGTSQVSQPVSGPNPKAAPTKGSYGQDYNKDGRIGFGERIRDMFDGGGPAVSGGPFRGGGLLSAFGNAVTGNRGMGVGPEAGVGFAGYGYQGPEGWVSAFDDMRNGGGAGMMGPTFQGGGQYSLLANLLGITPMGAGGLQRPQMTVGTVKTPAPALSSVLGGTPPAAPPPTMPAEAGAGNIPLNPMVNMPVGMLPMHMQFVPGVTPATPRPEDYGMAPMMPNRRFV